MPFNLLGCPFYMKLADAYSLSRTKSVHFLFLCSASCGNTTRLRGMYNTHSARWDITVLYLNVSIVLLSVNIYSTKYQLFIFFGRL